MPQNYSELELQVLRDLGMAPGDPAAEAMLSRIADVKGQQQAGDPAFQAGSRFFSGRHGGQVQTALSRFGQAGADGPLTIDDLLAMGFGGGLGGGGGYGGGGGGAFGSTEAGLRLDAQLAAAEAAKQREWEAAEADRMRQFERERYVDELKAERQRIFTDMLGTDPVRAILFAMGVGGEIMPGGERFESLPPLKGAQQQAGATEQALTSILGRDVGLGEAGVTGLPSVVKAATAYSAGQGARGPVRDLGAARTLLPSAYGVGAVKGKGRPGMSREETLRQIASVTPTGALGA